MDLLEITDSKSKIHKHFLDDGSGKILKHINICTVTYSTYIPNTVTVFCPLLLHPERFSPRLAVPGEGQNGIFI